MCFKSKRCKQKSQSVPQKPSSFSKRCHRCGRRLYDLVTAGTGTIAMKCPKCGAICVTNMAMP
jgi:uncharacterized Zn finger protein